MPSPAPTIELDMTVPIAPVQPTPHSTAAIDRDLVATLRESGPDMVLDVRFEPLLADDTHGGAGNRAVRRNEIRCRCTRQLIARTDFARPIHQHWIGETMTSDEVSDFGVAFSDADRKDFETLLLILLVGRPQLGGIGVARRSIAVHERDGDRSTAVCAQ